jgi:branched-chain amino acid transport system permease protein
MYTQLLNGIVYGSLLFIVSTGLVLIYGLRRVVNFAHGALYTLGAYVGFSLLPNFGFAGAIIGGFIGLFIVGMLLDIVLFRAVQDRDALVSLIATFGLLLIIEDMVKGVWGRATLSINPPELLSGTVPLFGSEFPTYRLAIVAFAVGVVGVLAIWLRYTSSGLFIRAASVSPHTAGMLGVNTDRLSAAVVGVGAGLAGVSGVLASPLLSLSPTMGSGVLVGSFVVTVLGGLGSFAGAFVAAMIIGEVQVGGSVFLPEYASILPFLLMAAVLIWRPGGLFGANQ